MQCDEKEEIRNRENKINESGRKMEAKNERSKLTGIKENRKERKMTEN
jgi:hypothetical protein